MRATHIHRPTFRRVALFAAAGTLAGALYGMFFGAMASLFEGGPTILNGIRESWWWFASFGAVAGFVIAFERDTLPTVAVRQGR
jgi:hypothetical protein